MVEYEEHIKKSQIDLVVQYDVFSLVPLTFIIVEGLALCKLVVTKIMIYKCSYGPFSWEAWFKEINNFSFCGN
jgi:hypothetical protein